MAQQTAIEWCDLSWNPTHGCSKVSPGCAHCYAETLSRRYKQTLHPWTPQNGVLRSAANPEGNVILKPHKLREPLSNAKAWRGLGDAAARAGKTDGKLVFVNSMSDLFHEQIPDEYIDQVFAVMAWAHWHTFQVLTKRPERMREYILRAEERVEVAMCSACMGGGGPVKHAPARGMCGWPGEDCGLSPILWPLPNVWLGVSIENRRFVGRADILRETPAAVRFISAEPLLGPLLASGRTYPPREYRGWTWKHELSLKDIDWVIAGGESGPGHRPIDPNWVRDIRDACQFYRLGADDLQGPRPRFLFKQWGGSTSKSGGRELDGRTWDEFPQVRP